MMVALSETKWDAKKSSDPWIAVSQFQLLYSFAVLQHIVCEKCLNI